MTRGGYLWAEVIAVSADFPEMHKLTATRDRKKMPATLHKIVCGGRCYIELSNNP